MKDRITLQTICSLRLISTKMIRPVTAKVFARKYDLEVLPL
jgi:hypothetical protein